MSYSHVNRRRFWRGIHWKIQFPKTVFVFAVVGILFNYCRAILLCCFLGFLIVLCFLLFCFAAFVFLLLRFRLFHFPLLYFCAFLRAVCFASLLLFFLVTSDILHYILYIASLLFAMLFFSSCVCLSFCVCVCVLCKCCLLFVTLLCKASCYSFFLGLSYVCSVVAFVVFLLLVCDRTIPTLHTSFGPLECNFFSRKEQFQLGATFGGQPKGII